MTPFEQPPVRTEVAPFPHALGEQSFQELMAERLKQAPLLALSVGLHLAAGLLLFVLLPPEQQKQVEHHVQMTNDEPIAVVEPEQQQPKLEPISEPTTEEILVTEQPVATETNDVAEASDFAAAGTQSAFDSNLSQAAVGIGGNAGGPYGNRGPGGPGGGGHGRPFRGNIEPGLDWLKRHQDADGKWDCDSFPKHDDPGSDPCSGIGNATHDVGVTGLALLAFLGDGSTLRSGPYKDVVKKAVHWLRRQQDPATGLFGQRTGHDFVYDHAIAAYAMCEAFGLSGYETLRPVAQRGLDYLESHRNPYGVWRYQPRGGDNDTSITGWCIMAYESGAFFGLVVDRQALRLATQWLDEVSDATGQHGYSRRGEGSARKAGDHAQRFPSDKGEAMTAVGLFSRFFLGQNPKEVQLMRAAADRLLAKPPVWNEQDGSIDHYYWYYATYALFQMGGNHWATWRKHLEQAVGKHQHLDRRQPNLYGSWDPKCVWGEDGGRVYSTAILVLTLQAMHRYTRLVR